MWIGDNLWGDEKVFFRPGDIVKLKHSDIDNRPNMLVIGKEILTETVNCPDGKKEKISLLGMRCMWYDSNQTYQEKVYSTKDLIKINNK